ncbi:DUF2238 domain-containing protein [Vibrio sp. SS-MA-C1-2]|uniref:DUF2238 domain-containing protein n=1 Tax=Vibrio sp. SS-MA-C1-2 TaxID=2908646 RepID=UPI001F1F8EB9|nr:DUF2238 domain-containing protein [Vibrio sp. SS-MA-C1-2]UJF17293.1 DUF2238 domain-containing protein [Vibrio sp. SS-MA-C1-2]
MILNKFNMQFIIIFLAVLIWSGINPKDQFTWFLEVVPAIIGVLILIGIYHKFKFTHFTCIWILIHSIILMVGGHYTYAEVPLFDTISQIMGWERNNYDKVGHFAQGFIPAAIAMEVFTRNKTINSQAWLNVLVVTFCLAISAFYELIEWWVAIAIGQGADEFLGTQGYIWDTQSDMFMALIGAICFVLFFKKIQSSQIQELSY